MYLALPAAPLLHFLSHGAEIGVAKASLVSTTDARPNRSSKCLGCLGNCLLALVNVDARGLFMVAISPNCNYNISLFQPYCCKDKCRSVRRMQLFHFSTILRLRSTIHTAFAIPKRLAYRRQRYSSIFPAPYGSVPEGRCTHLVLNSRCQRLVELQCSGSNL
ncbi:hypothetical protein F4782DRAFT_45981 [Xylaria castorea]|nr:hypothetical protein F4782DRAFT_45981 [Xylaria castorea]